MWLDNTSRNVVIKENFLKSSEKLSMINVWGKTFSNNKGKDLVHIIILVKKKEKN